jgi:hypothetical protein
MCRVYCTDKMRTATERDHGWSGLGEVRPPIALQNGFLIKKKAVLFDRHQCKSTFETHSYNYKISPLSKRQNKNKAKEATVKTTVIKSFSRPLIAPEWSEFVTEELVLNLWSCMSCGNRFETEVCMPADAEADAEAIKDFFQSLLVA